VVLPPVESSSVSLVSVTLVRTLQLLNTGQRDVRKFSHAFKINGINVTWILNAKPEKSVKTIDALLTSAFGSNVTQNHDA